MKEIKKIDNRASGKPEMKYQYFELCQLAEYPHIEIKIVGDEAWVYFDGKHIDCLIIKEAIDGIVIENINTMKEVQRMEEKRDRVRQRRLEKELEKK